GVPLDDLCSKVHRHTEMTQAFDQRDRVRSREDIEMFKATDLVNSKDSGSKCDCRKPHSNDRPQRTPDTKQNQASLFRLHTTGANRVCTAPARPLGPHLARYYRVGVRGRAVS